MAAVTLTQHHQGDTGPCTSHARVISCHDSMMAWCHDNMVSECHDIISDILPLYFLSLKIIRMAHTLILCLSNHIKQYLYCCRPFAIHLNLKLCLLSFRLSWCIALWSPSSPLTFVHSPSHLPDNAAAKVQSVLNA